MEAILVVLIAVAAAAAVAYPLVRGGSTSDPHLDPDPREIEATDAASAGAVGPPEVEAEVARYRTALRAGTLCPRCTNANAAGSRFCSDCGGALAPAPAAE